MNYIVVNAGYKMYQDDNEKCLTVTDGNSVVSGQNLYVTEKDYTRLQTRKAKEMSDAFSYYDQEEPDTVTISKKEYKELLAAKKKLEELKLPTD